MGLIIQQSVISVRRVNGIQGPQLIATVASQMIQNEETPKGHPDSSILKPLISKN